MVDARILNTAAALKTAVLTLAAATPISRITVSDVTREAGINRATFYAHYASPSALLANALTSELDEVREADTQLRLDGDLAADLVTRKAIADTAAHIDRHLAIYRLALGDATDGTIQHVLSSHLTVSSRQHLSESVDPGDIPGDPDLVAAFVANGLVGAIAVAVVSDHWDKDRVADVLMAMMPDWWD
ncbi:TetR/AcrR family transcriptional regulator [Conyzicola nivalis]|uniref:TetR family transcriptional regulator n=1 Tax=Conyzicola nivalis TaxID=1477021 RepID=A0A916WDM4_9MICO|nr:TetR/AcrR family transcriptional regulator [Conyzicola nivalis]GGA90049.1 TetR family transcriptional regulator [Conyzicola nivalis]